MAHPSYSIPSANTDTATEEPKIITALSDLKTLLSGNLEYDAFKTSPGANGLRPSQMQTSTSGRIIVCNASGIPQYVAMSGDATISATGVLSLAADSVGSAEIAPSAVGASEVADASLTAGELAAPTFASVAPDAGSDYLIPNTTPYTVVTSPALTAGTYAVWWNHAVTCSAVTNYVVNATSYITSNGVQVSPVSSLSLMNGSAVGSATAIGSARGFEFVTVGAGHVIRLVGAASSNLVLTTSQSNTRLRYARLAS